jgi:AcrR family transcriptional regulator
LVNRRGYHLGRRQAAVDRTAENILRAARQLVAEGAEATVGAIARRAGVSRITVYNRFGSRADVLGALLPHAAASEPATGDPRDVLRRYFERTSSTWAVSPGLYRHLPRVEEESEVNRKLAEALAGADGLRPGCSIREAEDVIAALSSFSVFDRLHKDGRRSPAAVSEILVRLAGAILA